MTTPKWLKRMLAITVTITLISLTDNRITGEVIVVGGVSKSKADKKDFEVTIKSDNENITILAGENAPIITVFDKDNKKIGEDKAKTVTGSMTKNVNVEYKIDIPKDGSVRYEIRGSQEKVDYKVGPTTFTPPASPTDVPTLGWRIDTVGTVSNIFLLNAYLTPISFDDLLFQFPSDLSSDTIDNLLFGPPMGVTGFVSSGTVPGAPPVGSGELFVATFPIDPEVTFVTSTFDTAFVDDTFSPLTARNVLGAGPVPQPATLVLLSIGILSLVAYAWRRKKRCPRKKGILKISA